MVRITVKWARNFTLISPEFTDTFSASKSVLKSTTPCKDDAVKVSYSFAFSDRLSKSQMGRRKSPNPLELGDLIPTILYFHYFLYLVIFLQFSGNPIFSYNSCSAILSCLLRYLSIRTLSSFINSLYQPSFKRYLKAIQLRTNHFFHLYIVCLFERCLFFYVLVNPECYQRFYM